MGTRAIQDSERCHISTYINDAIDMSVFILDNLGLDTTEQTLNMYAQSRTVGISK